MTVAALFCLGTAISLSLGCQRGQPSAPSPVSNATTSEPVPTTAAVAPMLGPPGQPPAGPPRVTFPRSPSAVVRQSKRPFTPKQLAWLSRLAFTDFDHEDRGTTEEATEILHTTKARPTLGVTVRIDTCTIAAPVGNVDKTERPRAVKQVKRAPTDPRACLPMQLPVWQARSDELKQFQSKDLVARSDTRFDVGTRNLSGATAIYTYQLGHLFALDDRNQVVSLHSNAYILYYNDGVNRIRVTASYLDDAVSSRDRLLALAPREYLEKMAVAFTSYYLRAWR